MVYQPNKPLAGDKISQSQVDLEGNFQALNVGFSVDHVAYDLANAGTHKVINFITTPIPAPPAPTGTNSGLYPQAVAGITQLFFKNSTVTTQLTGPRSITSTAANPGYITLPGGLILQWTVVRAQPSGNQQANFPIAFPNTTFSVQITPNAASAQDTVALNFNEPSAAGAYQFFGFNLTTAFFRVKTTGTDVYIFAIGN